MTCWMVLGCRPPSRPFRRAGGARIRQSRSSPGARDSHRRRIQAEVSISGEDMRQYDEEFHNITRSRPGLRPNQ